jgi:hypothetical protein
MEVLYKYKKGYIHYWFLILIGGFGLSMFIFGIWSFIKLNGAEDGDVAVFIALGSVLSIIGASLFFFSWMYFKTNYNFYKNPQWVGVAIEGNNFKCVYFDNWKYREIEFDLSSLQKIGINSNKGQRFMSFEMANGKRWIIPTGRFNQQDIDTIINCINANRV